jgi:hypothetical protein
MVRWSTPRRQDGGFVNHPADARSCCGRRCPRAAWDPGDCSGAGSGCGFARCGTDLEPRPLDLGICMLNKWPWASAAALSDASMTFSWRRIFPASSRCSPAAGRALASGVLGRARCLTFPRKRIVRDFTSRSRENQRCHAPYRASASMMCPASPLDAASTRTSTSDPWTFSSQSNRYWVEGWPRGDADR